MGDEVVEKSRAAGWWRGVGITGVALGALVLARVGWGVVAQRMLDGEVRGIRERGEAIRPGDFDPERVVDPGRNAAVLLERAAGAILYTPAENRWAAGFAGRLPLSAYDVKVLGGIAQANARSLKWVREARTARLAVDWGVRVRDPVHATAAWRPTFNADRDLGTLLCNAALYQHSVGNSGEALDLVRDALFLSRTLETKGPLPVAHMSAVGVSTLACQALDQMAPTLPLAARDAARDVIGELLEETSLREGLLRGLRGKRMFDLAVAEHVGRLALRPAGYWALRPMFLLDTRRVARADSSAIDAAAAETYPVASRRLPPAPASPAVPHLADVTRTYSGMVQGSADAYLRAHHLHLLDRRFSAAALAVRLYRLDHGGAFPRTLADLVPGYLPAVPADPMSRDAAPIGYVPGRPDPVLYSVGMNALDERGDARPYNPRYPTAPRTLRFDIVYPLLPSPPPPAVTGS